MLKKIREKYNALPLQAKASFWFLSCTLLQKGISTITTPIFTRLFSTAEYGSFGVYNSWLGIISVIITFGLTQGVCMQGLIKYPEQKKEFLSSLQGLVLAFVILWSIIYALFYDFWNRIFSLSTIQMIALIVTAWTSAIFSIWASEQRVSFRYQHLVRLSIMMAIAHPLIEILFVLQAEDKVTARILASTLVSLAYICLFFVHLIRGKKLCDSSIWKYAILFSLPLIPQAIAEIVLNSSDRIMISNMIGQTEAGIYSLAYSLAYVLMILNSSITQTISPWIYQKLKNKDTDNIAQISTFALLLVTIANLFLIAVAPEAVKIFAPGDYYEAIWAIPPIAMSIVFVFLSNLFAKAEFYYERTYFVMIASSSAAIVNILLNWIFVRRYGYYAAAYTTLFCFFVDAVGHYFFMRRLLKKHLDGRQIYDIKAILALTVGFLVSGFIIMALYHFALIRYLLIAIVLTIIYIKRKIVLRKIDILFHLRSKRF